MSIRDFGTVQKSPICGKNTFTILATLVGREAREKNTFEEALG